MALSGDEREAAAGQETVFLRTSKSRENSMLPSHLREVERGGVTREEWESILEKKARGWVI